MTTKFPRLIAAAIGAFVTLHSAIAELRVGVARVDITPDYAVRLSGFGFRRAESEGVTQRIWAKAIAFADERDGPAILITTDNLGVPDEITQQIAERLAKPIGLKRERLSITASHTHTAPMLRGVAPTLFGVEIPEEHQANIDRYTREFMNALEKVALDAVKDIRPAKVEWGTGRVGFARNRRTPGGPVDHDLPLLVVRGEDGKVRAVWFSYACHCVTLSDNKLSGDWAGFAQSEIERAFPGAVALMSAGCGADANPESGVTGDKVDLATAQGRQLADEVKRMLGAPLTALTAAPATKFTRIDLAFDTPRTRAEWEERVAKGGAIGYHARVNLTRLDRGETLPTKITYPIQSWLFGDQLAAVFLPGEVVVDYSLRLKREFDRTRLAVVAYTNDAPCYIPSERVLKEGGYEGADAMIYYDRPNKFAPGLEQKIIDTVHEQLPKAFDAKRGTEGTRPLSPDESLRCIRTKAGLEVQLVAAEPLVQSPVAIDWDARGRLWVCEMFDYPTGLDEKWMPGGRIRVLSDLDGDGRYDKATLFLDGLPFPTGVTAFRDGAIICAAPDIIFAEDTDGDGRADKVEKWFSGFATDNYQARVNSITPGLDGWFYGANGLLGGNVAGIELGKRDFRFRADTQVFEPAGGYTQMSRVRDDWGRWFGCENGTSLYHFPLAERYVARNPNAAPPGSNVNLMPGGGRVFPISKELPRYNDPNNTGRFTAACGLGIYRDDALGAEYGGNAFTCEPAHNLVSRALLDDGPLPGARRADDERESEFLASTDIWFRPVQARTGPDGALYIVDMYRFLIEHPRWIAAERLSRIDVRAGAEMGRIWRVVRASDGLQTRPTIRDLTKLDPLALAAALDSSNGTERDRVQLAMQRIISGGADPSALVEKIAALAHDARRPEVRVHALCMLDILGALEPAHIRRALQDEHPRVREHAVRLVNSPAATALANDPDLGVRFQLALTLGEIDGPEAAAALQKLASSADAKNPWFRAAIRSSAAKHPVRFADEPATTTTKLDDAAMKKLVVQLTASATANRADVLKEFAPALMLSGDTKHGGEIFAQACAVCHKLGDIGHHVGPDLAPLREKPGDYWLQNILDPNAVIEPANVGAIIETKDGRVLAGIVKAETATSLTFVAPGGASETLLRTNIKDRTKAPLSLMPVGLEGGRTAQDMADLIAFLRAPGIH